MDTTTLVVLIAGTAILAALTILGWQMGTDSGHNKPPRPHGPPP